MSQASEDQSTPLGQTPASSEPQLAETETKLATNPSGSEAESSKDTLATDNKPTYTDMASDVAGSATAAAAGVKDSVFSMFGGGGTKEKKVEEDKAEDNERSGSAKAAKDKEAEEEEVSAAGVCRKICVDAMVETERVL